MLYYVTLLYVKQYYKKSECSINVGVTNVAELR